MAQTRVSLDEKIATIVLKDPKPGITDEINETFGLGMDEGYRGPYVSSGGAWMLRWNEDRKQTLENFYKKHGNLHVKYGCSISDWPEDIAEEFHIINNMDIAAWYPKPFSSDWYTLMWAIKQYNPKGDLYWELSFDRPYSTYYNSNGSYMAYFYGDCGNSEGPSQSTDPVEVLAMALVDFVEECFSSQEE